MVRAAGKAMAAEKAMAAAMAMAVAATVAEGWEEATRVAGVKAVGATATTLAATATTKTGVGRGATRA